MSAPGATLGDVLHVPDPAVVETLQLTRFSAWVEQRRGLRFDGYDALWRWSVDDLPAFWSDIVDFFDVRMTDLPTTVLSDDPMPRTKWFPGARLNYAEHALRGDGSSMGLIITSSGSEIAMTLADLRDAVGRTAAGLRAQGVGIGDVVASYLPTCPEAVVLLLASASIGAVYTSCTIEFGASLVLDRLQQLRPRVLVFTDAYFYRDRRIDRGRVIDDVVAGLPSVKTLVQVPVPGDADTGAPTGRRDTLSWDELTATAEEPSYVAVPFDHPLYVLYSSGTTGRPKAFVHAHGRILIEHLKILGLHLDVRPGDRLMHPTTTSWMLWNMGVSALLVGATPVFYEGDPLHPDPLEIWRAVGRTGTTALNAGAGVILGSMRDGRAPRDAADLSALRTVSATGSPFPADGFAWLYDGIGPDLYVTSSSGGTDLCTGVVGGVPSLPVTAGEMSARYLGAAVAAFDEDGHSVVDREGELVITRPMPSMPVSFVGDPDFARYRAAYFETYGGVWCHGDWIRFRPTGESVISGRSDATLNRAGVRIGTSEVYSVLEKDSTIADSVIVHLDDAGRDRLVLLVASASHEVGEPDPDRIRATLRRDLSPRHVPDDVILMAGLPRTLTGKRIEIPIKRILAGAAPSDVVDPGSLVGAEHLAEIVALRAELAAPRNREETR